MNVIITGADGFIGKSIFNSLLARGHSVTGLVRYSLEKQRHGEKHLINVDYQDTENLTKIAKDVSPHWVIHAAGYANPQKSVDDPLGCFSSTALLTEQILFAIKDIKTRFCLISSSSVYGLSLDVPISESSPKNPITPYGNAKLCAEESVQFYSRIFDIDYLILRVFSVYGPNLRKQVVYDTIQKALSISENESLQLNSTGLEKRDFIYIDDLVESIVYLTEANSQGIFNVGSGSAVRIIDVVDRILNITGKNVPVLRSAQIGPLIHWHADTKLLTETGFRIKVDLTEGLRSTVLWIKSDFCSRE